MSTHDDSCSGEKTLAGIDLDYRPGSYFRPRPLERYLLSKVKGAVVRERLCRERALSRADAGGGRR